MPSAIQKQSQPRSSPASRAVGFSGGWSGAAGHRGQDHEHVTGADGRVEAVEHAYVLVVEVDVDVAVELALGGEQLALGRRVAGGEVLEHLADVLAGGAD